MKDHLRFAVAYWHTFCGTGGDPFGPGTQIFPWDGAKDQMDAAKERMDVDPKKWLEPTCLAFNWQAGWS